MLKVLDRVFGCLLVLASAGHTVGTILWTQPMSGISSGPRDRLLQLRFSEPLNIVRSGRPEDKTLAAITAVGTGCWALVTFAFGKSIGNLLDPRPLSHLVISLVLVVFSAVTLGRTRGQEQAVA